MPEETGKSKVASWLTSQGLKKVSTEVLFIKTKFVHTSCDRSAELSAQKCNLFWKDR